MMASLLLSKGVFAARSVIFQGFGGDKLPINKSYAISIMSVFFSPFTIPTLLISTLKAEWYIPMIGNVQCTSGSVGALSCADKVANAKICLSEIEAWQTVLSLPDTVGEECARMEAFETSLFNIGAAVTSVRWHFGSTIKIQRWPCCFDNQLSMHNIPPVCATWISPGPGFSSALILKKRETFHSTLKKERNALRADKGVKRGKLWEKKQVNQRWYLFALSWKELKLVSSQWLRIVIQRAQWASLSRSQRYDWTGQNTFFVLPGGLQGRMHNICCPRRRKYISQHILLISVFETGLVVIWLLST